MRIRHQHNMTEEEAKRFAEERLLPALVEIFEDALTPRNAWEAILFYILAKAELLYRTAMRLGAAFR